MRGKFMGLLTGNGAGGHPYGYSWMYIIIYQVVQRGFALLGYKMDDRW